MAHVRTESDPTRPPRHTDLVRILRPLDQRVRCRLDVGGALSMWAAPS